MPRTRHLAAGALAAVTLVFGQAALKIESASLQTREDGPAVESGHLFRPGELAYGSFFVGNFQQRPGPDPDAEETVISLSYRVEVSDPGGLAIQAPTTGEVKANVRREDKEWRPKVRFQLMVPPLPPSGGYRVDIYVKDEFSGAEARTRIPFEVKGYDVAASDKLTVVNFRFQRSDRASEGAVVEPVYRIGDFVWVLFDAAGFQLGERNRYDVAYSLAVLDAAGKVLFEQDPAAELTESPSYPKRALPGALSIRVAEGTAKTKYQLRVRVTDRIGGRTAEQTGTFTVD